MPQFEDEREEYLSREPPLFLPPLVFSRRQLPLSFQFEDDQPSTKSMDVIETGLCCSPRTDSCIYIYIYIYIYIQ